jgi:hypothetical protein
MPSSASMSKLAMVTMLAMQTLEGVFHIACKTYVDMPVPIVKFFVRWLCTNFKSKIQQFGGRPDSCAVYASRHLSRHFRIENQIHSEEFFVRLIGRAHGMCVIRPRVHSVVPGNAELLSTVTFCDFLKSYRSNEDATKILSHLPSLIYVPV